MRKLLNGIFFRRWEHLHYLPPISATLEQLSYWESGKILKELKI